MKDLITSAYCLSFHGIEAPIRHHSNQTEHGTGGGPKHQIQRGSSLPQATGHKLQIGALETIQHIVAVCEMQAKRAYT